jgi:hypothetical protein
MHKMLAIVGVFAFSGVAWATVAERSALSNEENQTINIACWGEVQQGNSAFQSCVARQMQALQEHPTPDLSTLSPSRVRAVGERCGYLRRAGVAAYNDCMKHAIEAPQKASEQSKLEDELTPDYTKVFADAPADQPAATAVAEKPKAIPVAMTSLPKPGEFLPSRPAGIAQKTLAPAELFNKVAPSIFVVVAAPSMAEVKVRNIMQGSAVAITDRLLLTNCHVVKDRTIIKLVQDGHRDDATLVAADFDTDRCILKAETMKLVPVAGVRAVDSIAVGERAFAVGTPMSMERTLSEGLVSGIRREPTRALVQTSAPVSPGSSGGGLFDDRGNLIGITTLGSLRVAQNLNFAIAASEFWR